MRGKSVNLINYNLPAAHDFVIVDVRWCLLDRFEETNTQSSTCSKDKGDTCIGGYARVVAKVRELKVTKAHLNPIYLNAGDNFQGTLWYNLFRWNATSHFLNMEPADAMVGGDTV